MELFNCCERKTDFVILYVHILLPLEALLCEPRTIIQTPLLYGGGECVSCFFHVTNNLNNGDEDDDGRLQSVSLGRE
jgi:hypothetical protein